MKKLLIGLLFLFSMVAKAEVQIEIEPSQVNFDEPFKLILTQNNLQTGSGIPDLTPLRKDFLIIGTERSVNYSIINGQTASSSTWIVSLKAQKAGMLTIPPIKVGAEQTKPLTINVTTDANPQKSPDTFGAQQDILLTTEVSDNKPYVNQEIIYKVTLYNSKQLLDANYQPPKVENALLIPLGNGRRYQVQKNNTQYLAEEQSYAIFPQKSGPLKISPPVFTALIYGFDPQRITTKNKPITLHVQPIPPQYTGKIWLPAKQVKLTEEYENTGSTISQGGTLVRTVTIEGVGIPAQLLPTLNFAETDAFNVYPERGKENNQISQGEIVSNTTIKVTYLFNKNGKVTIPELKLPWFNIQTGKEEFATLPSKTLEVLPSANAPATAKTLSPTVPNQQSSLMEKLPNLPQSFDKWPWILTTFFACAWLITLGLWGWQKRKPQTKKRAYKKALEALHAACQQGNPQLARDALLKWANRHWPDATLLNLTDLERLVSDLNFKKQIQLLSQALYQNEAKTWRGDELWRCVQGFKQNHSAKEQNTTVLPPMNP